tara:strand:- start:11906 stop:12442 length:537 start_codon:yes stop_codon:yes gene_type:complete
MVGIIPAARVWAMPNHHTFQIEPIAQLLQAEIMDIPTTVIDPFARRKHPYADMTNDINPECDTHYNMDALEWVKMFDTHQIGGALFDPPYSLRQVKECYDGIGKALTQHETRYFFTDIKNELARVIRIGGVCISFGWNTCGLGKSRGFEIEKVLIVCHGGNHHDTLVTVERKVRHLHG